MRRAGALIAVAALAIAVAAAVLRTDDALPGEVAVSRAELAQSEVWAALDLRDPELVIAGSNSWPEGVMRSYTSTDRGATWRSERAPPLPRGARLADGYPPADPALAIDLRGLHYHTFLADTLAGPRVFVATRRGPDERWRTRDEPLDAALAFGANDKNAIAVDVSPASPTSGRVYVARTRFELRAGPRRERASIVITHPDDGGRTWSEPATVMSATRQPRVAVVYNRYACNGALDVWLASYEPSLSRRVLHRRVNPRDGVTAADQFQPVPAYDRARHDLWVCYYDTRPDPRRVKARFTCTVSHDGGASFERPQAAASVASDETGPRATPRPLGQGFGDYQSVGAHDGVAHPFWTDSRDFATLAEEISTTTLRPRGRR